MSQPRDASDCRSDLWLSDCFMDSSPPKDSARTASPPSPRRRDFAPAWLSSSVWSQGGESYAEQYTNSIGSPGQDLGRYTEGPARYLNGTPNTGSKAMLERTSQLSPRGRWQQGPMTGPAMHTQMIMDRKQACRRSHVGPDPYGLCATNLWTPRTPQRALTLFTPSGHMLAGSADDRRTPWIYGRTAAQAFDPYHLGTRNQWRQTSQSIKSIMPHGSPLLPVAPRPAQTSRMRSNRRGSSPPRAMTARHGGMGGGNPFH